MSNMNIDEWLAKLKDGGFKTAGSARKSIARASLTKGNKEKALSATTEFFGADSGAKGPKKAAAAPKAAKAAKAATKTAAKAAGKAPKAARTAAPKAQTAAPEAAPAAAAAPRAAARRKPAAARVTAEARNYASDNQTLNDIVSRQATMLNHVGAVLNAAERASMGSEDLEPLRETLITSASTLLAITQKDAESTRHILGLDKKPEEKAEVVVPAESQRQFDAAADASKKVVAGVSAPAATAAQA